MNWNRKPARQPRDPNRPEKFRVNGLIEFQNVAARADQLEKRNGVWELKEKGAYKILSITTFGPTTGNGGHNGQYEIQVHWHEPVEEQATLL